MQQDARASLDQDGYRANVAIVICNNRGKVLWARRSRRDGWQFPQGGVEHNETAEEAAFRELYEEVGLLREHVRLVGRTQSWLRYDVPKLTARSRRKRGNFRGQKQLWFLFHMIGHDSDVRLDRVSRPEFDSWRWVDYWDPVDRIVEFKRNVYQKALAELEPYISKVLTSTAELVNQELREPGAQRRAGKTRI